MDPVICYVWGSELVLCWGVGNACTNLCSVWEKKCVGEFWTSDVTRGVGV